MKRDNKKDLSIFESNIGYTFKDRSLLTNALTHSSYSNENNVKSNERLEFLGDSVLSLITTSYLYNRFDDKKEGGLTKIKRQLVNTEALSKFADIIHLGDFLLLGHGEEKCGGREKKSNLEDAFEALTGAIYLDGGIENAKIFLLRFLESETNIIDNFHKLSDPKTLLQEKVQETPGEKLEYVIVDSQGPDHDKIYTCEVRINSNVFGTGKGKTKKEAEKAAAMKALELLGLIFEKD